MSNSYLTSQLISKEAVAIFKVNNSLLSTAYRKYEGMFTAQTYAPGDTINVRLDNFFVGQRGDTVIAEDIVEASIPLSIAPLYSVPIAYTPTDLQRKIVDFSEEILEPAVRRIISMMNSDIALNGLTQINYVVGDTTAPVNSYKALDAVRPVMSKLAMDPSYKRYSVLSFDDAHELRSNATIQNSFVSPLNKEVTEESMLGRLAGMDIMEDQNIVNFIGGTKAIQSPASDFQVVSFTATTITIKNAVPSQTGVFLAGDMIQLPSSPAYNQVTRQALSFPMSFCVTQSANADGGGNVVLNIYPNIITNGPRQNITNAPSANDVVKAVDNNTANYCYTERGLIAAIPPLERMDSPESYTFTDKSSGVSLRVSKTAEVLNNKNIMRLDAQMASTWVPQQAVRLVSLVNQ